MADITNSTHDLLKILNAAGTYFQALERRISELEEKIARLGPNAAADGLGHSHSNFTPAPHHEETHAHIRPAAEKHVQSTADDKKECLYFANGADGVFLKSSGSPEFLDRVSLYCFEKINEAEAFVFVVDKLSVVRKFSSNPDALESFCEQLNVCGDNHRGIETVERGKAVLEGDKWRITTKVKIRYY